MSTSSHKRLTPMLRYVAVTDLLLFALLCSIRPVALLVQHHVEYQAGYAACSANPGLLRLLLLPLGSAAAIGVLFISLIVRIFARRKKDRMFVQVVRVLVLGMSFVAVGLSALCGRPGYLSFTEGFTDRMKTEADIDGMRRWLYTWSGAVGDEVPRATWPEAVSRLTPKYVDVIKTDHRRCLRLGWGSGFGHWGIVVGSEDMPTPKSSKREFTMPLEPGAYVWHEIQ